ncbi:phosphatidylglycerophosphatase A family protein [Castellaniella caeni]|uniref:phosphatidylglycerophosphatase A family protein n=1 Tax=Castellaniella caeni TaxID=266123 RepID=UPI000C9F9E8B|nr:phosphatidylglycerophosphatase A [Castellaniella caeni]
MTRSGARAPDPQLPDPRRPSAAWVFARPDRIIAFGFGSGLIHPAPGTWGTLAGWLLWFLFLRHVPDAGMAVILLLAFGLGCWVAQRCGDALGIPDHGGINWDEIVAIWLVLWLMPAGFWSQLAGVVLFRIFDILKPPPVSVFDRRFKNGFGVMIDDIVAALYALLVAAILIRLGVLP